MSCFAASSTVPALAFGPILRTSSTNESGPLMLLRTTSCPCRTKCLAYVCATSPAPINPNFICVFPFSHLISYYKSIYLDQKNSYLDLLLIFETTSARVVRFRSFSTAFCVPTRTSPITSLILLLTTHHFF